MASSPVRPVPSWDQRVENGTGGIGLECTPIFKTYAKSTRARDILASTLGQSVPPGPREPSSKLSQPCTTRRSGAAAVTLLDYFSSTPVSRKRPRSSSLSVLSSSSSLSPPSPPPPPPPQKLSARTHQLGLRPVVTRQLRTNSKSSRFSPQSSTECMQGAKQILEAGAKANVQQLLDQIQRLDTSLSALPSTSTSVKLSVQCDKCCMPFVSASDEDRRLHARYCRDISTRRHAGLPMSRTTWSNLLTNRFTSRLAHVPTHTTNSRATRSTTLPESPFFTIAWRGIYSAPSTIKSGLSTTTSLIIVVSRQHSPTLQNLAYRAVSMVTCELGCISISASELWSFVTTSCESTSQHTPSRCSTLSKYPRFKVFLFAHDSRVLGVLLCERIFQSYRYKLTPTCDSSTVVYNAKSANIAPAHMGVALIWTHPSVRQHGIAQFLVRTAQRNFIYGVNIPWLMTAFTPLTAMGWQFVKTLYYGEMKKVAQMKLDNPEDSRESEEERAAETVGIYEAFPPQSS